MESKPVGTDAGAEGLSGNAASVKQPAVAGREAKDGTFVTQRARVNL